MKLITAAIWPDEKKIGCAAIQRKLNCDTTICGWFPTDMVSMQILNSPVYIWKATEAEWRKMAREWALIDHRNGIKWSRESWLH